MAVTARDALVQGVVDDVLHFHYDLVRDVLYLRLVSTMGEDSYSEETPDGFILVRDMESDKAVGVTIISYWKRFGDQRTLGDVSLAELDAAVSESAQRVVKQLDAA